MYVSICRQQKEVGMTVMMVRVNCPDCGDIRLSPKDIEVSLYSKTNTGNYRFTCPTCSKSYRRYVDESTVLRLVSNGSSLHTVESTSETIGYLSDKQKLVKVTCSSCGDVELSAQQFQVVAWIGSDIGHYKCSCPSCSKTISRSAEGSTLDILVAAGASSKEREA